jgi:hypothetical protein
MIRKYRKFWHQLTRKMNTGPANFIVNDVFHLPKGSLLARYTRIFFVFFFSGFIHFLSETSGTMSINPYGAWAFFITQTLGVLLEDAVQAMYRSVTGTPQSESPPPLWTRVVGYIWVLAFLMFWSTPAWFFTDAHVPNPEGLQDFKAAPFGILNRLKSAK